MNGSSERLQCLLPKKNDLTRSHGQANVQLTTPRRAFESPGNRGVRSVLQRS